jgi:hypothetical protein
MHFLDGDFRDILTKPVIASTSHQEFQEEIASLQRYFCQGQILTLRLLDEVTRNHQCVQ